ncbi:S26 family signal peptidase [Sphingobium yanoikuyae]|uniref:Type VI secretion protein n=1 Tax=Sphingobium yanoikuyae TaxID=13690 RepID=A0A291MZM0_SPHYA|nr:S26 family signal peptidase [Sphingobium yanoikuyae]ATI80547.1 type VI secretion protein [Sphingobium yanoikuyae]
MAMAANSAPRARWCPNRRLWGLAGLFMIGIAALSAISAWRGTHLLLINMSASLPNWAFLVHRGEAPARGGYAFFNPPRTALLVRHFGARPQPFAKIVYGMPGDLVTHAGANVSINGRLVARMKPATRLGEPLTPGATGRVPAGCYYLGTPHPDGFDSRYGEIGFVCARQIIGTGEPIL